MRDDFTLRTKDTLARRAGMRCSRPTCRQPTSGPHTRSDKSVNIGVAAHIKAASPKGPRYDRRLTVSHRKSIKNGIWLCQNCAKLVDNDYSAFSIRELNRWKHLAERAAKVAMEASAITSITKPRRFQVPSSIRELIVVVDIQASYVLKEMDQSKKNVIRLFLNQQPTCDKDLPSISALDKPLVMWNTLWKISCEKDLSRHLDSLKHSFLELHGLYKTELRRGHYVAAHEILGQIHSVIFKHRSICQPAEAYFSFIMSMSLVVPPDFDRMMDRQLKINTDYPGFITTELAKSLPQAVSKYFLRTGKERYNKRRALSWALMRR